MAGSEQEVRERLRLAAIELFNEKSFERTTAAQIATRGGVTERTFFRYFADKREVLFEGEGVLSAALTAALDHVPSDTKPLDALFASFHAVTPLLIGNRAYATPRQRLIAATPALAERELAKLAALADILAGALKTRGVPHLVAELSAKVGMMVFAHATLTWLEQPHLDLNKQLDLTRAELQTILA